MTKEIVHPLIFEPVYKDYPWGGDRIRQFTGRSLPAGTYAESWEVADRPEGMSVVSCGPLAGRTLGDLVAELGPELIGTEGRSGPFPLLAKIIDARERSSLQVHPDEVSAVRVGGEPKTEMWLGLEGMEPARIFAGLKGGVNQAVFCRTLERGAIEMLLNEVPFAAGDAIFVPGGRVHAIDAGCLLFEIQQNSDTTYRLYDWGRVDANGNPRPLHMAQALAVIHWEDAETGILTPRMLEMIGANVMWQVCACAHFRVGRLELNEHLRCENEGRSFRLLFVTRGELQVEGGGLNLQLHRGSTCLLPAALRDYTLLPEGTAQVVIVTL